MMKCTLCHDCGWVCENHPGRGKVLTLVTAAVLARPCPWCNVPSGDKPPRMPDGFETDFDKKGWRH
jgi:hypothetical protein